jgi:succinate-semialdehyde dehydrogenase/glutarate-semialdehyde dehydrogenase
MSIASINPATGEVPMRFEPTSEEMIDERLARAVDTFRTYRKTSFLERSKWMLHAAEILESEKAEFGKLMTTEMGKPLKAAIEEAEKCARGCRFYAENAERFLTDEVVQTNASRSYVHYQALGAILAVMPWNFPFWQVFRFAAPALMAGNVALLKHASNVPQCALAIEAIIRRAGFPEGAFQTLLIGSDQVKRVLEDPRIVAATLTGSEPAGSDVASIAGKYIKKTVLELGGSDPFIVMPTGDLVEATRTAVKARCINNGQSCIAAKRFIVHQRIADEFEQQFVKGMEALKVGDPMDEETDIGPLATPALLEQLHQQVQKSVSAGARILTGGKKLQRPGHYYTPTVLTNIPENSLAYREEIFGPVALLFRVHNIDEAISLANDTAFGLGSAAWTNDEDEKRQFIEELDAGAVFINGMVASDPRLPFGGVKHSGYGRELGVQGIREFVNTKTVWIK